ncbi:hypothetical protein [Anaeroarcus burkinensis]|uniref:hypothetical protein n=1 Tax=Anaeroarcus burkinensis TaxID=82376 RepID=UPI0003FB8533|nr:hypothetical protein [Anaeroarcus burkinensis]
MIRILRVIMMAVFFMAIIGINTVSFAGEDDIREVTVEATYKMGDNDTPAKAEEQVLLRAKRNALEQTCSLNLTMEQIASLPESLLAVTVLDKSKSLNNDKIEYWTQIKAVVHVSKLEAAVRNGRSLNGTPPDHYIEYVDYIKGGAVWGQGKQWHIKNRFRDQRDGLGCTYICDIEGHYTLILQNNKYCKQTWKPAKEEVIGTEVIGNTTATKSVEVSADNSRITIWTDSNTGVILKTETLANDGKTYVHENKVIQIGPLNPALVEVPAGYKECSSIDELFTPSTAQPDPTAAVLDQIGQKAVDKVVGDIFNIF